MTFFSSISSIFESNIDRARESARLELEIFDRAMASARLDSSNKDFVFDSNRVESVESSRTSSMLDRRVKSAPNFALIRSSVNFEEDGNLVLTLPASKTDYFRKGVRIPLAAVMNGSSTCPVVALRTLFNRFPASPKGYSQRPSVPSHEIISSRQLEMLSSTQVSTQPVSLIIPFEEEQLAAGIPWDEIRALGRWKNDAVDLYFKFEFSKILIHSRKLHIAPLVSPVDVSGILADLID